MIRANNAQQNARKLFAEWDASEAEAREIVEQLLAQIDQRSGLSPDHLMIGGFIETAHD